MNLIRVLVIVPYLVLATLPLALVLALSAYHVWMAGYAASLARGERRLTGRQLRMINEVPGIAAALIVVLVVVRPF